MGKLSYEDKINIYEKAKSGISIINIRKEYNISRTGIYYLINLIEKHGINSLRISKNQKYSRKFKEIAIQRVLAYKESTNAIALDLGLSSKGMLLNWVKKYKENGYNIVERKRGRSPTMIKKPKKNETLEEKIKRLEEENLYLKAEIEYTKKLRAVVQARKSLQQKKK